MKKIFSLIAIAIVAMACALNACAQASNLSISNYKVRSVKLKGITSVDGTVLLNISNKGAAIVISEVRGAVYKGESLFMTGTADDIVIPSGGSALEVVGHCHLSSFTGVWALLSDPTIDPAAYNVDIYCKVGYKGSIRVIDVKNIPLSTFLSK